MDAAFVDAHTHIDQILDKNPDRIPWLAEKGAQAVGWAWSRDVMDADGLAAYLKAQAGAVRAVNKQGLACVFLTGVHPRNITPDLTSQAIPGLLSPHLDDPLCRGVGEIGLEEATDREKEILAAQLSLAPELAQRNRVFGVHTPRNDKSRVTDELLDFLEGFDLSRDRVVIDHTTEETIGRVLGRGYFAGITLSPIKTGTEELVRILGRYREYTERILLNTDSGTSFYENLYILFESGILDPRLFSQVARDNAVRFFNFQQAG